jgi:hypothetical protein
MATEDVTIGQIVEEFKAVRSAFDWRLSEQGRIQGTLKNDTSDGIFDPVTAVAFIRTGEFFPEGQTSAAARKLGLSFLDSAEITTACTYGCPVPTSLGGLREILIRASFPESAFELVTMTFGMGRR